MSEKNFCTLFHLDDRSSMAKKPRDRMNALLENPNTADAVQALDNIEFYDLYHAIGPGDAMILLEYASPEQLQTCLDPPPNNPLIAQEAAHMRLPLAS